MSTTAEPITPPPAVWHDLRPRRWSQAEFQRMLDLGIFVDRGLLILAEGRVAELVPGDGEARGVEFTLPEFCKLWDANFFRDQRVQLLGGEILEEPPMNPPHVVGIRKTTRVLERVFAAGHDVGVQF